MAVKLAKVACTHKRVRERTSLLPHIPSLPPMKSRDTPGPHTCSQVCGSFFYASFGTLRFLMAALRSAGEGRAFTVSSPLWGGAPITIQQDALREIGFKLYPAALVSLALIEAGTPAGKEGSSAGKSVQATCRGEPLCISLSLRGLNVLELGAGCCGLLSIAAAAGGAARVCATDLASIVPHLAANLDAAAAVAGPGSTPASAAELQWGKPDTYAAAVPWTPDVVVGADIVYYEELIQPLLHCLLWLTGEGLPAGEAAPLIVITYVQRVRKGKAFVPRARAAGFDVRVLSLPHVVDYDVLLDMALHPPSTETEGGGHPPMAGFSSASVWHTLSPGKGGPVPEGSGTVSDPHVTVAGFALSSDEESDGEGGGAAKGPGQEPGPGEKYNSPCHACVYVLQRKGVPCRAAAAFQAASPEPLPEAAM